MVLTKKFSEFSAINKSGVNTLVGLSDGDNAISDFPINWTTALRPVAPSNGFSGYNTDLSQWEYWNGSTLAWVQFAGGGAGTVSLVLTGTGLTGGPISTTGTVSLDIPVTVPHGGTGVTSVAAYAVICGGVTASDPLQVVSGLGSAGQVLTSNGAGALPTWQTVAGSGTVNTGLINQVAWYAANGSTVSGLPTVANGILATSAGGVPSIATSLPAAVQSNITALGTIASGVWQGTNVAVDFGGTGVSSFTAYAVICGGTTATGDLQNVSGLGSAGQVLTSNGAGGLPSWQNVSGTGTVNSGLQNQLAYYAANGTTVSGLATGNNGVLVTSAGGVPSISSTLPAAVQANITTVGTIGTGVWQGTPVALAFGGTNANLTADIGGIFYSTATAGAILGGTATARQMLQSGASAAPAWSTSTWPATTSINRILYSSASNTVSEIVTMVNGTLITSAGGVPSISQTLPAVVQGNITTVGTVTSGVWQGTPVTVPFGGTGNTTFTAYAVICAGTTATGAFQNVSGVGLSGQVLTSNGAAALPTWQNVSGTGTVNSGNQNELAWYAANGNAVSGLATAGGGVLVTSTAGVPSILADPGLTGAVLHATSGGTPAWSAVSYPFVAGSTGQIIRFDGTNNVYSTSTFADTYAVSTLLYASSANTVTGLATTNSAWLRTSSGGVPQWNTSLPINLITAQVFLTPAGSATYTPTSGLVYADITMVGAGGGSGAAEGTTSQTAASAPGNGAGVLRFIMTAAQIGASKTYTVGAGGVAGTTPSGNGGNGDNTLFADWVACGGEGGVGCASSASSQVKAATTASGSNTVGTGTVILNKSSTEGNTSFTLTTSLAYGGNGGTSFFGAGGKSRALVAAGTGTGGGGQARGGGAGGSVTLNNNTDVAGATGQNGAIYVVEYCSV